MDFNMARDAILATLATIAAATGTCVLIWKQISKQRLTSSTESDERKRLKDAFESAKEATERAHKMNNEMATMQYRMGRLEAENEQCAKRTTELFSEVQHLKEENKRQEIQITALIKRNLSTDYGS
jgi:uncharacterized protein HemX